MHNYFSHVVNGQIKGVNIRRGGTYNGKRLGIKSPDSTYALYNLFPQIGEKPEFTDKQRLTGPVINWDDINRVTNKVWTVVDIPAEELAARLLAEVTEATQKRLDDFAQTKAYDSMLSACTYVTSSVARLKAEGQYCVDSRDSTWETLYTILGEVEAGISEMPESYADIEPELPVLEWPI